MSLNSRLSNLFTAEDTPPAPDSTVLGIVSQHDGLSEPGKEFAMADKNTRMHRMEATTEGGSLEVKRPPYLHVGFNSLTEALESS